MNFEGAYKDQPASSEARDRFSGDRWELETRAGLGMEVYEAVEHRLAEKGWSEEEIGAFPSVVKEAVDNAVIHGNWGMQKRNFPDEESYQKAVAERVAQEEDASGKKVIVEMRFLDYGNRVEVGVQDEGPGFAPEDIPDPTAGDGTTKTSGRGWFMMAELANAEFLVGERKVVLHWKRTRGEDQGWVSIKDIKIGGQPDALPDPQS